jgi:phage terminase large subunit
MLAVCIREVQKTLAQSSKAPDRSQDQRSASASEFKVFNDKIETPGDGIIIFQGMQDHTAESIKSLEGFKRAWIEEAQTLSQRSLTLLRPTIRASGSQIWASWNPRRKSMRSTISCGKEAGGGSIVVQANWRDNPWFPAELEAERQAGSQALPGTLRPHLGRRLRQGIRGRLLRQAAEPGQARRAASAGLRPIHCCPCGHFDLGGSGANADAL